MMRVARWILICLKYVAGVICWFLIFGYLRYYCIFDITAAIDSVGLKNVRGNLVRNLIGDVALHVQKGHCVNRYLYVADYHPSRFDVKGQVRALSSLVDLATWREIEDSKGVIETFIDSKHKYVLFDTSDGIYLKAVNRSER